MEIKDLKPNPKNPRTITDEKLKMLEKSLKEFGSLDGFIFNRKTKQMVSGHQRQKLLPKNSKIIIEKKHLKPTKTGTLAEGYVLFNGERFPYREVSWDKQKEKLANLSANRGAGEWDTEILSEWFKELDGGLFDLDLSMFDVDERKAFESEDEDKKKIEDDVPAVPKKAKSKLGDIYELGEHRLMCGDSTDKATVEKLMNGAKADICFTSHPYNAKRAPMKSEREKKGKQDNKYNEYDDGQDQDSWLNLMNSFLESIRPHTTHQIINVQHLAGNKLALIDWLYENKSYYADTCIWDKGHGVPSMAENVLNSRFEYIYIFGQAKSNRGIKTANFSRDLDNVYCGPRQTSNEFSGIHAATFPIHLPEFVANKFTKNNGSVVDVFGGTGSTLIACEKTKRKCFMSELDPHYVDVIIERFEKYSGKKAKLTNAIKKR